MKKNFLKKCIILGMTASILTGCGNVIPELTEEEASLVATYAADAVLQFSVENESRLMDTEKETARREEMEKKVAEIREQLAKEEEELEEEAMAQGGGTGSDASSAQGAADIASFIGLDGFEISYAGYELQKSYPPEQEDWELTIDATQGMNLLVVKMNATNTGSAPAVLDMVSKDMLFHIDGKTGNGDVVGGTALMTMLLSDFAFAQDEIGAGESREYVLMIQVEETITEMDSLSLYMKKDGESMTVNLQ